VEAAHPSGLRTLAWLTQIPVAVLSLVHAVRISHATRMLSGAARAQLGLFQSLVLNMIVLFGSSTLLGMYM